MRLDIGRIVIINSGKTIYITAVDDETQKYTGYDINDSTGKEISFRESDIAVTV